MSWSDGYVTEIDYTHGYYRELSPVILDFALLMKGLVRPKGGPLRYLELGFGQGLSLNIHAAACPGEFWGTDFSPSQAVHASELALRAGSGVHVLNESFSDFLGRGDLPCFDIIGIHGIWSWISASARQDLLKIISRKLNAGGIVYISYNCFPGFSSVQPVQHLMALHAAANIGQDVKARIDGSLDFIEELGAAGARFFAANPGTLDRVKDIRSKDKRYVAHEYFNQNWYCSTFAEMAGDMAAHRMSFAGSAHLLDHVVGVQLSPAAQAIVGRIPDMTLRETTRDYFINQQFRRDIFGKGLIKLSPLEQRTQLGEIHFLLTARPEAIKLEVNGGVGKVQLRPEIYEPIIACLKVTQGKPMLLADICQDPNVASLSTEQIIEAVLLLVATGSIAPTQPPDVVAAADATCRSLNGAIFDGAQTSDDTQFLASPVLGSGVPVSRIHRLFLGARREGFTSDEDLIRVVGSRVRARDPLRPTLTDMALEPVLQSSLEKDLASFKQQEPVWTSLGII